MKSLVASFVIVWLSVMSPAMALAEGCIGFGCSTSNQETNVDVTGQNTETGEGSTNTIESDVEKSTATSVDNNAQDTTEASATAGTGENTANQNSGTGEVITGDAGIGFTSVKNDNTTVVGGQAGLSVSAQEGGDSDYTIDFGSDTADLSGGGSYQAVNETTGANSENVIGFKTKVTETTEIQNDGQILNLLNLIANTGGNEASMNTGGGVITTGDANVAATLINLLNTTVINGHLMISVADIFGDLVGNVVLPDLAALASLLTGGLQLAASNQDTGANSTNTIGFEVSREEQTTVANTADVNTVVNAEAITGQNEALGNTGGALVKTGDGSVSASSITVANTTVEGGNWGLVIVNALNRWLGFLVGDNGQVIALSQEETIEAINSNTGANSDNTIAITDERERTTTVTNDALINNEINASAITGQNEANYNTGAAGIATGDANVQATAVNIVNTVVKDASLFIAVVNIFGDWFGDLLYDGTALAQASGGANPAVQVDAANQNTGAESENMIDANVDRLHETDIDNQANINTTLNATIDTGTNRTNKNTLGAVVDTGQGLLALHSRAIANITGIAVDPALGISIQGLNDTTGFDSQNKISAKLNDERIISIDNLADISTIFASLVNTGNNEANQNTGGGIISTGDIDANVGIQNLVNRVILALVGGGFAAGDQIVIDADFLNQLTGALSENENEVEATYTFLADIMNRGLVNNLLDLIFNTGGNAANMNTGGASLSTGSVCVDGDVANDVNSVDSWKALGGFSLNLDNLADVTNDAGVAATTGNNQLNMNTNGAEAKEAEECEKKLAEAPPEEEKPGVGGPPSPEASAPEGGGEEAGVGGGEAEEGKVAAAVIKSAGRVNGGSDLKRFPVAGGEMNDGAWLPGAKRSPWIAFVLLGGAVMLGAWYFDQQGRRKQTSLTLAHN